MAAYVFETLTDAQAAAFTANDTLTFSTPGATASQVLVAFIPSGDGFSPAKIALTFNGVTREFRASALAGFGGFTGQINFADGSMLYPGTGGADCILGSGFSDGL